MSLSFFKLKEYTKTVNKDNMQTQKACEKPCCCDLGYCHHYGQGL